MKYPSLHFRRTIWFGSFLGRRLWIVPLLLAVPCLAWAGLFQSLFHDEWQPLIYQYAVPAHTGAFHLSLQASRLAEWLMHVSGVTAAVMRLPYLFFGILTVLAGWRLGRVWRDWTAGFLLALLLTIWPFKIYYDAMIREYAIEICLFVAMLVHWEAYRMRPTTLRLTVALGLTLLAALTHELAIIALVVPPCYLVCPVLARAIEAFRRRRHAPEGRAWWRRFLGSRTSLRFGGQALLAGFFMLCTIQFHSGPDFTNALIGKALDAVRWGGGTPQPTLGQIVPPGSAFSVPVAEFTPAHPQPQLSERARKIAAKEPVMPTPGESLGFIAHALKQIFLQRHWSPAPLLGLTDYPLAFDEIISGHFDSAVPPWLRPWIPGLSLFFLAAGSLALAFKSPPLLASLWTLIFANGLLVTFNLHLTSDPGARYYFPAAVATLFAIVAALELPARLIVQAFGRRPRRRAWAILLFNLLAGAALILPARAITRNFATIYPNLTEDPLKNGFVKTINDALHPGILFLGNDPQNWAFINKMLALHQERQGTDFWNTPRRNIFLDAEATPSLVDLGLLDRLNHSHALVIFQWNQRSIPTPLVQYASLFKFEYRNFRSLTAQTCDLGHQVFVTRGHALLPLQPRFEEKTPGGKPGTQFRLDLHYEVPGVYELAIGQTPTCRVTAVEVAGKPCPLQTHQPSATPSADPALQEMLAYWPVEPGQARPFHTEATTETVVRIPAPPTGMQAEPQLITITFNNPPGHRLPLLRWTCAENAWTPVTADLEIGSLSIEERPDAFLLGAPLRLRGDSSRSQIAAVFLTDASDLKKNCFTQCYTYDQRLRDLKSGDIVWVGPIRLARDQARQWLGKSLILTLLPQNFTVKTVQDTRRSPLTASPERRFAPLQQFLLARLKFTELNGRLGLSAEEPR